MAWWAIDRLGLVDWAASKQERPSDALPAQGDPFTPWYETESHLHIEGGRIVGIHFKGSLWEGRGMLERLRRYEFLLTGLDPDKDISVEGMHKRIHEFEYGVRWWVA